MNLAGYMYWSATDVWESSMGYGYPMGLIAIDLRDGKRIPRDSYYYQKVIKNNMVDEPTVSGGSLTRPFSKQ